MDRKYWNIIPYDKAKASALARVCGVDDFAVLLLQARGIDTPEAVEAFLSGGDRPLSSPFLIKDMDKAYVYYEYALRLARANIITLQQADTFKPEDGATRAQLASIVDKLIYPRHR